MNSVLRRTVEFRRQQLIDRLIALEVYKINGKHLFELTLTELEDKYQAVRSHSHSH
ncbi:Fur-regulated basic protein FbpA [Sporolactobacillus putidus]|uniref:Fur-regulated basic protein FbpA n=1 Tax=Sporolactobacillus putidus TaxID=492735 RepID=A0A917W5N4_9BACL|nr:Fur-regulated basic protein FbpA [Sporolactobacillus putidus]GGL65284.1 hypothetical protein GCM10007968_31630 [Sporolactobacillus putidus]